MKSVPLVPAQLEFTEAGIPFSPEYADIYHPHAGALRQARHVFLGGNELPRRWQGRAQFSILETGFGLGNNFLATWDAWRNDADRPARLSFVSIEQHPLRLADLVAVHRDSPLTDLTQQLTSAWPALTHNLHRLSFENGQVELLLAFGDAQSWLPELEMEVDAFYLDGFTPARNPRMWDARVCKALGRRAAPGATLATWSAAQALRQGLQAAGFEVRLGAGTGGKRDITLARYAPAFVARPAPRRAAGRGQGADSVNGTENGTERRALIVGGGLAGCAAAWALAERGWRSTLFERRAALSDEASGNPAGLFHGIVNAQDGIHARFNRAAALAARVAIRTAIESHHVAGGTDGLLRLETTQALADMRAMLAQLGLPEDYVAAAGPDAASLLSGLTLHAPAWHYPGGGWVHPAGLARSFIERGGSKVEVRTGTSVQSIRQVGRGWQLTDAGGSVIDEAETLVLANAGDALRLLNDPAWGMCAVRGQLSLCPVHAAPPSLAACRLPVAGSGYLLPPLDGMLMFGATSQAGDDDPAVRASDHEANLRQLRKLTGLAIDIDAATLHGRTAWRWTTPDRLPVVGAVPELAVLQGIRETLPRWEQPRFVPRQPGLFVFTGLGSRGITWSALGAHVLASIIADTPSPLEASLLDAIDPARFVSRQLRRAAADRSAQV